MRLKLSSCEILYREICACIARAPHQVDVTFMPKGLHDIAGKGMCERLQAEVDAVDESRYDAIAMGYLLCGNGVNGLTARGLPLVLPRGHDCITLFLGSRERYQQYFDNNPGVYFKTSGWIERGKDMQQLGGVLENRFGLAMTLDEMIAKYGEDNGRYLWEQLGGYTKNYGKLTFIRMGIGPDNRFERQTREEAAQKGMAFEKVEGDISLIRRLVDGDWEGDDFLHAPPGHRIVARHDGTIVGLEKAE